MSDSGFKVHALELGPMLNFVYLVEDINTRQCAVVDPAWDVEAIVNKANQLDLKITDILLTHSHHDHINGIEGLLNHGECRSAFTQAGIRILAARTRQTQPASRR